MTTDLSALIARLEAAEVGGAELDYLIDEVFSEWKNIGGGWAAHKVTGARRNNHFDYPDSATTSLDAALALVERVLPGSEVWVGNIEGQWEADCEPAGCERHARYVDHKGATPALALCIAILRAKQGEGA